MMSTSLIKNKGVNSLTQKEKMITSKDFWIYSIYLFFSISLLTSVHMYEYLKCMFC